MKKSRTRKQWLADLAAVLSLLLPALFIAFVVRDQRISANPETAIAVLETKRIVDGGGESPIYYEVRYSFTAASGGWVHGQANVGKRLYDRLAPGDGFEIQYAADDPSLSRVPGEFNGMMVEAFAVGAQGAFFFGYLGPRRWLRTLRGEPDPV